MRLSPRSARRVISHDFTEACPAPTESPLVLIDRFAEAGITGGAVYDGLVALAAHGDDRVLLTRDERAERTYRRLQVAYELVIGPV